MATVHAVRTDEDINFPIVTVHPLAMVHRACVLLAKHNSRALLVRDSTGVIGIFTESDLLHRVLLNDLDPHLTPIRVVMSSPVVSVPNGMSINAMTQVMLKHRFKQLPVHDERGNIIRIVSSIDLLEKAYEQASDEVKDLMSYVMADGIGG